jgi:L-ribulose-5-phosphate 3-epimerase
MSSERLETGSRESEGLSRRELICGSAGLASAYLASGARGEQTPASGPPRSSDRSARTYDMKKSINLWAFPYPSRMSLRECLELAKRAGFEGVEVNYDLEGDISLKAGDDQLRAIGRMARDVGIAISGVCSFLFWPYSMTAEAPETRKRGIDLAGRMIRAAALLGTENLLVVPGAVFIPWMKDVKELPYDVVDRRAREAVAGLIPQAEKEGVYLNIENIFVSGYLMTPGDMVEFVDSFKSDRVRVHFDTGNIMFYQFPEDYIPKLGKRIQNVHLKEYTKKGTDFSIESFRPLLDGTTNWPAVMEAFDKVGYRGYLTFEYFHPYTHYPEALIYHTSDALDRMLGRKA